MKHRWIVLSAVLTLVAAATLVQAGATAQDREQGRRAFMEQGCYGCHTIGAVGTAIGPDLSHVGAKYSAQYLDGWLRDPSMQRPSAHMPKLELTDAQIAVLVAYLASLD